MPVVRYLSTRIAVMYKGKIVETGETAAITLRPNHPDTRSLLDATPRLSVYLARDARFGASLLSRVGLGFSHHH